MAISVRKLSFGAVKVYGEQTLGVGSYGKVCKATYGQLPCAAKLLHDTMFGTNDPGVGKFVERFEQECQFLRMIKHPNIVQFLGTLRDPRSRRLALMMELMDESLTRFLDRSIGPLPYHTQLNICHDVALALAYLHSNDIIHRDLSSNNVLLINEGRRAKVTDFGMSKLSSLNPQVTPLTTCPGTATYMPPEALITPPRYCNKLDCFSHGVLTIQIATRQFPNPGDAHIEDPNEGTFQQVPEVERRKKDIDLVEPDHPLLPIALDSLKQKMSVRPSADDLCERLAALKFEVKYAQSVERCTEQSVSLATLQLQIQEKEDKMEDIRQQLREKSIAVDRIKEECAKELSTKDLEMKCVIHDCQAALRAKTTECEKNYILIEQLRKEKQDQPTSEQKAAFSKWKAMVNKEPILWNLTWRQGAPAPRDMTSYHGAAVVHGNMVYFSQECSVYSYEISEDEWTELGRCDYDSFSLAVVHNRLTTIGGCDDKAFATNILLTLSSEMKWQNLLPAMCTSRVRPAAVTTLTHLVVAGGRTRRYSAGISSVEILDVYSHQWFCARSSPLDVQLWSPYLALCDGLLYLSQNDTLLSCSMEELLKSCKPASASDREAVWTSRKSIPVPSMCSLTTLRGHILAIGGNQIDSNTRTGDIHCYDSISNSWSFIGELPTPRCDTIVAVLSSSELIVVGGYIGRPSSRKTEIVHFD